LGGALVIPRGMSALKWRVPLTPVSLRGGPLFLAVVSENNCQCAAKERQGAHDLSRIDLGRPRVVLALIISVLTLVVLTQGSRCGQGQEKSQKKRPCNYLGHHNYVGHFSPGILSGNA
jgi:hypothetical protein